MGKEYHRLIDNLRVYRFCMASIFFKGWKYLIYSMKGYVFVGSHKCESGQNIFNRALYNVQR